MRAFPMWLKILGGIVRINESRAIYYNNERIKAHLFNTREKREIRHGYLRSLPSNL
jgi:hypothetical protein